MAILNPHLRGGKMEDLLREYIALVVRFLHKRATWGELKTATEEITRLLS